MLVKTKSSHGNKLKFLLNQAKGFLLTRSFLSFDKTNSRIQNTSRVNRFNFFFV